MTPIRHDLGGYAYDPGLRFAGNGVVSLPDRVIDQAILREPLPFKEGCIALERHFDAAGIPLGSLCGLEVRLPATLSLSDFVSFNDVYMGQLDTWGLLRHGVSPLTRTNVSPVHEAPSEPTLAAISYVSERPARQPTYVISGIAELPSGGSYPQEVLRTGETTPDALHEKASLIVDVLERHLETLGLQWAPSDTVNLYSAHDLTHMVSDLLATRRHSPSYGLLWHNAAPPVVDLELEIDLRRYGHVGWID
ncbi:hypothetical protein OG555_24040 [Kribbella sp. NBC_01484]|uniref:hypothetical protein n=1 Tax=Kribbella sp. NBC_01484 TaxID=2903579 RepID=UPI002E308C48|nr:hypothetical protein [Kribbella sp. NBC_01484]